ncbi:hypothetical protein PMIN01_01793 [Paraphaeosphaeria minitans]|uniref:Uncharacterized protein n=1 Tax=Paraphaeosphaeria minitans TaxID=565426 RepID=A0A9P6GRZ5_9PLEO|nr:hypothetical protein PMIN01_01793 [Paraphaeosphaeria minitans]
MSWNGGGRRVSVGKQEVMPQRSDLDTEDKILGVEQSVLVSNMKFKLV